MLTHLVLQLILCFFVFHPTLIALGFQSLKAALCQLVLKIDRCVKEARIPTGIPLACGLKLLVDGKILQKGVFAPEGAINPNEFFKELNNISDLLDVDEENNTNEQEMINIFRSW